ncbi:hypothetical protein QWZ14_00035 [Paeniroseomonas aquatica]|uniref:Uncharacterized protein n=1 Tax=Paeniroseomonas aquatica TaxID=373043 RepID=A0ABT7ZZ90_9PROT|nr:hypothetical protein [Paeniroseomonas aquatica]MDN3562777.1 hypothetical protein [Paeniroseomonas aquatica]
MLAGHAARLATPRGFVLDEAHVALRAFAAPEPAARAKFCAGIDALPPCSAPWAGRWPTCMPAAAAVRAALAGLPADWLRDAARRMAALVTADREGFRRG